MVRRNTMARQIDLELPDDEPVLHYADYQPVVAWKPIVVQASSLHS
jgi:hypothetical protein